MKKNLVKGVTIHKLLLMQISRFCAESEKFALLHDHETVTFRNSVLMIL